MIEKSWNFNDNRFDVIECDDVEKKKTDVENETMIIKNSKELTEKNPNWTCEF